MRTSPRLQLRLNVISDTFWTNPQYHAQVCDADEGDADNTGTIIVGLMQKERRKKRSQGLDLLTLGYSIYKVKQDISSFHLLFCKVFWSTLVLLVGLLI